MKKKKALISISEARKTLARFAKPIKSETIAIEESTGRVLASKVRSQVDVPHFEKAAMDGYAVKAWDTRGASMDAPVELLLVGYVFAGQTPKKRLGGGECIEIATGAMMPEGADAVVMVEYTSFECGSVKIMREASLGEHIVQVGSDISEKQVVLSRGTVIAPRHIALLATIGLKSVDAYKKPRIAIISTGDELVKPGGKLVAGRIYATNNIALANEISILGATPVDLGFVRDSEKEIAAAILAAVSSCDAVFVSGGSSVGREDHVPKVVSDLGKIIFHGVSMKPGKPVLVGQVKEKLVVGVPGYPTSAITVFHALLKPLVCGMVGVEKVWDTFSARLKCSFKNGGRHMLLPVRLSGKPDNHVAEPVFKGSSAITSLSAADGFIEVLPNKTLRKNSKVIVKLF